MWFLQNFAKGLIVYHFCRSLGSYDMSFLTMLKGKHYTYEGAFLAKTYNNMGVTNEKTIMNLERV
jgi:hypothetical protein